MDFIGGRDCCLKNSSRQGGENMRRSIVVGISIILLFACNKAVDNVRLKSGSPTPAITTCLPQTEVSKVVQRLSTSLSDPEFTDVKKILFSDAEKSETCSQQVITTLMAAMNKPNLDLTHDRIGYSYWDYGATLLGELKATEALDLLIAHLSATDGLSINMSHYPAVGGVISMGPIAIPKLTEALRNNSDRYLRRHAIYCLASIGGSSAEQALQYTLPFESDRCNRELIQASLEAFKNPRTPNRIVFDPERAKWYAAFDCNGQ